ncbi:MAG TPA: hypothetical protein PLC19_00145 [Marmoricola sp.]|nr:hypothetical protein [Marmoricola sp.]
MTFRPVVRNPLLSAPKGSSTAAFKPASAINPTTIGFLGPDYSSVLFNNGANPLCWCMYASRLGGYLEDDVIVAHGLTWNNVFVGVSSDVRWQVGLYTVDVKEKRAALIPGSVGDYTYTATGSVERTELLTLAEPVALPRGNVIIAAAWAKMTFADHSSLQIRSNGPGGQMGFTIGLRSTNSASFENGLPQSFNFGTGLDVDPRNIVPGIVSFASRNQFSANGFLL